MQIDSAHQVAIRCAAVAIARQFVGYLPPDIAAAAVAALNEAEKPKPKGQPYEYLMRLWEMWEIGALNSFGSQAILAVTDAADPTFDPDDGGDVPMRLRILRNAVETFRSDSAAQIARTTKLAQDTRQR